MVDLVILLGISLAVTLMLGLLLAGFVWAPWLVGLTLLALLLILLKVSSIEAQETVLESLQEGKEHAPQRLSIHDETSASRSKPVMLYRGVKYQRGSALEHGDAASGKSAEASTEGKYRGQPWKRSQ